MDEETRAELAALRSEIASLRMELAEAGREMAGGEGADVGLPLVPIGGGDALPGAFEPVYADGVVASFGNCVFCAERQFVDCGTMSPTTAITAQSTGYVVLKITHPTTPNTSFSANDASVDFATSAMPQANQNDAETVIPIYHITNGVVDIDLRAVPTGVLAR